MRTFVPAMLLLLPLLGSAQVELDRPLVLEGLAPGARQIVGLDSLAAPGKALVAGIEQDGQYRLAAPMPGALWDISVAGLDAVQAGTQLLVVVPENASGEPMLQVNQGPAAPVRWGPGTPVDGSLLEAGSALSVVYTGAYWQVLNGTVDRLRECPPGLAQVNELYCIERVQRPAADFATAALACAAQGLRLCTWGEFIAGCQRRTALGLQISSSDWEWTGNSANEENNVRVARFANCTASGHRNMTGPAAPSRCCFTR